MKAETADYLAKARAMLAAAEQIVALPFITPPGQTFSNRPAKRRPRIAVCAASLDGLLRCTREIGCKTDQVVVEIADDQTTHGPRLVARALPDASA